MEKKPVPTDAEIDSAISDLEKVVDKIKNLFEMTVEPRGEWHKDFLNKMIDANIGIDLITARSVVGIACDYMSPVYIQGYGRGYEQGHAEGFAKAYDFERGYRIGHHDGSRGAEIKYPSKS